MIVKTGLGQDSHRFEDNTGKKLILGGVLFENHKGLKGNSDADVILHSITNAISGVTGKNILGKISDQMCQDGIKDSEKYLEMALKDLNNYKISHVSISIECKTPKITPQIDNIKENLSRILKINKTDIGLTATTGESLTDFGKGLGMQAFSIITVEKA